MFYNKILKLALCSFPTLISNPLLHDFLLFIHVCFSCCGVVQWMNMFVNLYDEGNMRFPLLFCVICKGTQVDFDSVYVMFV